jgi:hypothetical protein
MMQPPMNADQRRLKKQAYPCSSAFIGGPFVFFSRLLDLRNGPGVP